MHRHRRTNNASTKNQIYLVGQNSIVYFIVCPRPASLLQSGFCENDTFRYTLVTTELHCGYAFYSVS